MRSSSQLFPDNQNVTMDDLITARSEAKNDMGDINALLHAIELSLMDKLKDHDLSKLSFDKVFRLIGVAKTQAEMSQDYHNGELAQLTGGQYQLDELKNTIGHLDSHQDSEETKVKIDCLAPANSMVSKTLINNFQRLDITGNPEERPISPLHKGMTHDKRR
ncbi:TPA: hypothetical protein ACSTGS_003357 [Acinetobacter baumannii]|uniref:hypothetical protein n=1 Tax=Acinetobacter nosocomialis TaxID=106654 RepID=UPI0013D1309D|nr:hypothetical protein [Acinetobacter nosocomialis]HEM7454123.1 hypothetical protein [Acinetobacter nosocomialis]